MTKRSKILTVIAGSLGGLVLIAIIALTVASRRRAISLKERHSSASRSATG